MIKNFVKVVVRNLLRYKTYTLINIVGMGIGVAAMIWGYQTYRFSFSFDDFHADRDHVYRALTKKEGADGMKGLFPLAAVQAARGFAGIRETVRLDSRGINIKTKDGESFAEDASFTDASFFTFFNFPVLKGVNDLSDRSAVLITEKIAKKYFGDENPIGKTLIFYVGESYATPLTVKGVLKDLPVNSTIKFDFLTNFDNELKPDGTKIEPADWSLLVGAAFIKIDNPSDALTLAEGLKKYLPQQNKAREDWKVTGFKFITLRENALLTNGIEANSLYERPDNSAAYGPFVFAFLIFLSACLNFSNTTVARAHTRLKEIGMRKVMGSTYAQLILQMLLECAVIVAAAILLSVLLNMWWLPAFNEMFTFVNVQADYLHDLNLQLFLGGIFIATTLLAGIYPAFYISRFNPSSIFRGTVKFGGSDLFSRLMLGLQIAISIITVVAGIAFARNAIFQRHYDFGYNLENTMGVMVNDRNTYNALKNEMASDPQVIALAGTKNHISFGYKNAVAESQGIKKETNYLEVGQDYIKTMNLKVVNGRSFDAGMESDYANAVIISQKMAGMYGWKDQDALGKLIHMDTATYSVIGVLKDFHSNSFFEPLEPAVLKLVKEDKFQYLIVQAKATDLTHVYAKTKAAWEKLFPLKPFHGFYQNEIAAESYRVTTSIAKIFSWFAIVSMLLTATGLFALVSLTMLKKLKEIAVRKVVGASPLSIFVLINKKYFWIFVVSSILGSYGGWALTKLLLDMIFKVNAGLENFTLIISVVILFLIALGTSTIKILQAVRTNPVKLLRTE